MGDLGVLHELGAVVVGATAVLALARAARLPPLLGYLAAGLVLGPVAGIVEVTDSLDLLAHLGVALLLFLVGLELSVDRIREVGRTAVLAGTAQVALTLALGAALAAGFGFPPGEALLLGLATSFSSTVVVVKLLEQQGDLRTRYGRVAVGVLLVQDVAVALALTAVAGLAPGGADGSLYLRLAGSLLGLVALVAGAAAAVRWGLGRALEWLSPSAEAVFVASLAWCLGFILAAETVGLSVELGAFVAGVAAAQVPRAHDLHRRLRPLVDFLLAVFFVGLGAGLDAGAVLRHGAAVLALSGFVLVAKPVVAGGLLGLFGESDRTGLRAGLTLGQVSEFAFVLVAGAAAGGLVRPELLSVVGGVGLITIAGSAVLAPAGDRIHALLGASPGLLRLFGRPAEGGEAGEEDRPDGHVVVVGMNVLGRAAVRALNERGERVVAVDTDPAKLADLPAETVIGDANVALVLEEVGAAGAKLVVSALRIEDTNRLLAHRCAAMDVPLAVHAVDAAEERELEEIGADFVIASKREGAERMLERVRRRAGERG